METSAVNELAVFGLLVLPGFISMRIFDLFNPTDKRPVSNSMFEGLAFGILNALVFFPLWIIIDGPALLAGNPMPAYALALFTLVVAPVTWGLFAHKLLRWLADRNVILGRHRTAFDAYFSRQRPCWVIVHLHDGQRVGGLFGGKSYASFFPKSGHLYLEELWELGDDGAFKGGQKISASAGMIFRPSDYRLIEIFDAREGQDDGAVSANCV